MKRRLLAVAASAALALGIPATTTGATASPGGGGNGGGGGIVVRDASTTKAEHDKVVRYWTPRRMRGAVPAERLVRDRDTSSADGRVATGAPQVVSPQAKKPAPGGGSGFTGGYYEGGGTVTHTTGKVFFTLGGTNYVCSGSSVSAANRDLVLTAGHCLNEGPGAYATNWAFVPAYDDGARPHGTFTARKLVTTTQWAEQGDFDHDVAFAVMNPVNGTDLADTVGAQGIGFNLPRGEYVHAFGYPQASPYDGSDIAWCHGTVIQDTFGGSADQGLDCNMTGGSSGGPWFRAYDATAGVGTLTSVNSFKYRAGRYKSYMFGPYLGSVAQNLYGTAQNL